MYHYKYNIIVLNWKEFDIFYHVPNYNITSSLDNNRLKVNKICRFKYEKIKRLINVDNIIFDCLWCDLLVEMIKNEEFKRKIKQYITHIDIKWNFNTIFNIYYQIFSKLLIVNNFINRRVNQFINYKNYYPYTGIQIRVGNDDLHEPKFSDERDVKIMINLAGRSNKYNIWYLTGDSQRYKYKLRKKYKNIIMYSLNKSTHYDKHKTDYNIIIEHEILSKSKFLIISKSTFGITASLKSGLLLYNEKNCFLINNKTAYDLKNYIINISW